MTLQCFWSTYDRYVHKCRSIKECRLALIQSRMRNLQVRYHINVISTAIFIGCNLVGRKVEGDLTQISYSTFQ